MEVINEPRHKTSKTIITDERTEGPKAQSAENTKKRQIETKK